jgi:hypothetical protein
MLYHRLIQRAELTARKVEHFTPSAFFGSDLGISEAPPEQ